MNVVFANKYHFLKGGAERYMFDLRDLLVHEGHSVVPFSMRDGRNESTGWSDYFVSPVLTERMDYGLQGLRTAGRMLYSFEARRKFARLLDDVEPDIVHLHNIYHQLSPSILQAAKERGVPVVMTAHDYHLIAPNYSLWHHGDICSHTQPDRFMHAALHGCVKGSFLAGALEGLAMHLHRWLGLYPDMVDRIIAPSAFMAAILEEYGIDGTKIVQLPHPIDTRLWTPRYEGDYALFVGRLSGEKGVETLVRAASLAREIPVRIVGTGPEDMRLHRIAEDLGAHNVTFVGFRSGEHLKAEYERARFVVVPSVWYEVFGLVVQEAYASGKPVIASQMGALSELVRDGITGIHVSAGRPEELAEAMRALWHGPAVCRRLGKRAREWVDLDFTPKQHLERLMEIYSDVM